MTVSLGSGGHQGRLRSSGCADLVCSRGTSYYGQTCKYRSGTRNRSLIHFRDYPRCGPHAVSVEYKPSASCDLLPGTDRTGT